MSRNPLFLVLILALSGCGEGSKQPPAVTDTPASAKGGDAIDVEPAGGGKKRAAANQADATGRFLPETEAPGRARVEEEEGSIEKAFAAANGFLRRQDLAGAIGALEAALPSNGEDLDLLFNLMRLNVTLAAADPKKPDYARFRKGAEYLRLALKAEPKLAGEPGFRQLAARIHYDEARALAAGDKQPEKALKVLREALEFGFRDFDQLENDAEFASVRSLPEFPEILASARAAQVERLKMELESLFAETKPFDFDFMLTDIEGDPIAKADFLGKVLVVDVWGTWCPPCRAEIPHFVALQKKFEETGLAMVGLNSEHVANEKQANELIREFHKENGMNYRCALVKNDTIDQIPDMEGFPTTLFFDRKGKLRVKVVGGRDYDTLEMIVEKLLDEKSEPATE